MNKITVEMPVGLVIDLKNFFNYLADDCSGSPSYCSCVLCSGNGHKVRNWINENLEINLEY